MNGKAGPWLWLHFAVDDLIDRYIGILIFQFYVLLFLVELIAFYYFGLFLVAIVIVFRVVFQPYLHVFHSSIEVADVSDFFPFAL